MGSLLTKAFSLPTTQYDQRARLHPRFLPKPSEKQRNKFIRATFNYKKIGHIKFKRKYFGRCILDRLKISAKFFYILSKIDYKTNKG